MATSPTTLPEDQWVMVSVPAILDPETWAETQRCLAENKATARRNARRDYLLRGMIFCPCGRRWVGRYKANVSRAYYRCPTTKAEAWQSTCPAQFSIRADALEAAVWGQVADYLLHPDSLFAEVSRRRDEQTAEAQRRARRFEAVEAAITDVDRKWGRS
jgi:site-specific DNA recombinase